MPPLPRDRDDRDDRDDCYANSPKLIFENGFVNLTHLLVFDINLFTWNLTLPVYNRRFRLQIATPLVYNRR